MELVGYRHGLLSAAIIESFLTWRESIRDVLRGISTDGVGNQMIDRRRRMMGRWFFSPFFCWCCCCCCLLVCLFWVCWFFWFRLHQTRISGASHLHKAPIICHSALVFFWPTWNGFYRVLLGFTGIEWAFLGFACVSLGFTGFQWVFMGFPWVTLGFHWVQLGFYVVSLFSEVLLGFNRLDWLPFEFY